MIVSLIVAMDEAGGIGYEGQLPWRLPDDLKRFKELTMGHYLIMGRKTFDSIGRPLPGRKIIILTGKKDYCPDGVEVVPSLYDALRIAKWHGETEAFIGGGAAVFAESMFLADRIYLTRVHACLPADVFFPEIDSSEWHEDVVFEHPADERHAYAFTMMVLNRTK
jgi:dihydrofolate reductase